MRKTFLASLQLIVRPEPFAIKFPAVCIEFELNAEESYQLKAEYEADTRALAATDWEHGDDYVAQEFRALRAQAHS